MHTLPQTAKASLKPITVALRDPKATLHDPPIRAINSSYALPPTGYLRLWQIIGNAKADPPIPPLIPVSKSTWWAGVKAGKYPPAIKISARCTAWKVESIRAHIEGAK